MWKEKYLGLASDIDCCPVNPYLYCFYGTVSLCYQKPMFPILSFLNLCKYVFFKRRVYALVPTNSLTKEVLKSCNIYKNETFTELMDVSVKSVT